ncbi:hypothetical protein [Lentzea aerocolonigenes]|nr:hypothetical protein [Lentzea aerocolonigenes]
MSEHEEEDFVDISIVPPTLLLPPCESDEVRTLAVPAALVAEALA